MKRLLLLLFCLVIFYTSCSSTSNQQRGISSTIQSRLDLLAESKSIIDKVAKREINGETCEHEFSDLIGDYQLLSPQNLELEELKANGKKILDLSFQARLSLHSLLDIIPDNCKFKLKELNLLIRTSEDYVGVHFYGDKQVVASDIKFQEQAIPVYDKAAYHPFHVGTGIDPEVKFEFKNGDIVITKGVSVISSTISEIAQPKSVFSHIVFVHVDKNTKETTTIESYVGVGVAIYPIEYALKNENARILVLRSKDSDLASRAADYMYDKVVALKKQKKVIPYDYNLDFSENKKLSCEEVAYDSFNHASDGKVLLPEVMSKITMKDAGFLERIGLKKGDMMVPSDMETDSRFDVVMDWTDYRLLRDSWRKDAVLGSMFKWIEENNYKIHENFTSNAARAVWSTRSIPGVWWLLSKASGIPTYFTKDVPKKSIATIASLKDIGAILIPVVSKADQDYFEKNGKWMSSEMLRDSIDKYIATEPKELNKVFVKKED